MSSQAYIPIYPKILMTAKDRKFAVIPVTSSSAVISECRRFKMLV